MLNETFTKLVAMFEGDPGLLHAVLVGGEAVGSTDELIPETCKAYMKNHAFEFKFMNAYFNTTIKHAAEDAAVALCVDSCEATRGIGPGAAFDRFRFAGCDANSTCSCTSGTCGGATCGGSTCSATCTGDSCGNTCGDSCGYTTNLVRQETVVDQWFNQMRLWR